MTREERRESIRRLVDGAPLLPTEDIDRLRALLPMGARGASKPAATGTRSVTAKAA